MDCSWGKKNADLVKLYDVRGYPTVIFCDPDGQEVSFLGTRDARAVAKQILAIADKYSSQASRESTSPNFNGISYAAARPSARRTSQPIALYFFDDSPPSLSFSRALLDEAVKPVLSRFILAQSPYRRGSEECAKFDVTRSPTLLILDGRREKPEEKPMARIVGSRTARELARDLEDALGSPVTEAIPASKSAGSPPAAKEPEVKWSDDEIERNFIKARALVAMETLRRGRREKAIEILEDLLQNYPRHLEIQTVEKLLEEAKK